MLKITILYGAIRNGRLSIRAARAVERALKEIKDVETTFVDLLDYHLPVLEDRLKDMAQPIPEVARLGEIIAASDGIILVSPEYNNSYSGALKNMVDYYTKEWYHKPMGVVAASEGKQGGINASNLMQLLILAINGFAMPTKLLVPEIAKTIDEDGKPADEQLNKQINKFVAHFVWFTAAIAAHKQKQES